MSIRDINAAQSAYQQDWRKSYQNPLNLMSNINKVAEGYRALQQNLDTQDLRTQALNSHNELSTLADALKRDQIEGLRQYMEYNKANSYDPNGNRIGYDQMRKRMAGDPNMNAFAYNLLNGQQPNVQATRGGASYSRGGYGRDGRSSQGGVHPKFYQTIVKGLDSTMGKDDLGNSTGKYDQQSVDRYFALMGMAYPDRLAELEAMKRKFYEINNWRITDNQTPQQGQTFVGVDDQNRGRFNYPANSNTSALATLMGNNGTSVYLDGVKHSIPNYNGANALGLLYPYIKY